MEKPTLMSSTTSCFWETISHLSQLLLDVKTKLFFHSDSSMNERLLVEDNGFLQKKRSSLSGATGIILIGQCGSGKTSLLYRLKLNNFISTAPTAFPVTETFKLRFTCVNHCHKNGGLPPLFCCGSRKYQSCQLIQEKVKMVDAGRVVNNCPTQANSSAQMKYSGKMAFDSVEFSDSSDNRICLFHNNSCDDNPGYVLSRPNPCSLSSPSSSTTASSPVVGLPLSPKSASQQHDSFSILPPWTASILQTCDCAIIVLDATSSRHSIAECRDEIVALLFHDSMVRIGGKIAILVNKQDVKGSLSAEEVSSLLGLPPSLENRRWAVFAISVKSGEGISDSIAWLLNDPVKQFDNEGNSHGLQHCCKMNNLDLLPCQFRLIPNDVTLDRFNFEEIEEKRLLNPFYCSRKDQKINGQKVEEVSMSILSCPHNCRDNGRPCLLNSTERHHLTNNIHTSVVGKCLSDRNLYEPKEVIKETNKSLFSSSRVDSCTAVGPSVSVYKSDLQSQTVSDLIL